jgi:hypothetical protein
MVGVAKTRNVLQIVKIGHQNMEASVASVPAERPMAYDPKENVALYGQGPMTLLAAIERVMKQKLQGLEATIFRDGEPSILDRAEIEKLAAEWGWPEDADE